MDDAIETAKQQLFGPGSLQVTNISVFPGTDPHATPAQIATEISRTLIAITAGDYEMIPDDGLED
jgi:hypothetical protein